MNMCQSHWDALREKVSERGLDHLIASSGEVAIEQQRDQIERGETSAANYDPLMASFFAIGGNAMQQIERGGGNPLYPMTQGPEDPVGLPGGEGRTWPRCALCYLNLAHELTCSDHATCVLDRERGFDWMLDRAADDAKQKAIDLGLAS